MDFTLLTSIIYLTVGVLLALIGILIFRESPSQRINRATAVMLILAALAPIMGAFGLLINKMNAQLKLDLQLFQRIFLIWEFFFPQLLYFSLISQGTKVPARLSPRHLFSIPAPSVSFPGRSFLSGSGIDHVIIRPISIRRPFKFIASTCGDCYQPDAERTEHVL